MECELNDEAFENLKYSIELLKLAHNRFTLTVVYFSSYFYINNVVRVYHSDAKLFFEMGDYYGNTFKNFFTTHEEGDIAKRLRIINEEIHKTFNFKLT